MTDYETINRSDITSGDDIRVTLDDGQVLLGTVSMNTNYMLTSLFGTSLFVPAAAKVERKAAPAPTQPGLYVDKDGDRWVLLPDGGDKPWLYIYSNGNTNKFETAAAPNPYYAPFTLLAKGE
jgi:hypothetical protein